MDQLCKYVHRQVYNLPFLRPEYTNQLSRALIRFALLTAIIRRIIASGIQLHSSDLVKQQNHNYPTCVMAAHQFSPVQSRGKKQAVSLFKIYDNVNACRRSRV